VTNSTTFCLSVKRPPLKTTFLKTPVEPELLAGFWAFSARNDLSPSVALRRVVAHVLSQSGYEIEDYDPTSERTNDYQQWARRRKAIDERGTEPFVKARVTPGMKAAFDRYASARNATPAAALKALVQHIVRSAQIDAADITPPKPPPLRSERVTVRLSSEEMEAVQPLAKEFGGVREWIVALVRSRIRPGAPQFALNEVQALYESNRELWALGRNVNQIAHAMNLDIRQAGRLEGSASRLRELESLKAAIDHHTAQVVTMCNESFNRWSGQ
jgi:hypothetical protein